jgi:hypothetical protein
MKYYVMLESSRGNWCFLVSPGVYGQRANARCPWMRAENDATVFPDRESAVAARDALVRCIWYEAPELNGRRKRLEEAVFVSISEEDAIAADGRTIKILGQEVKFKLL